MTKILHEMRVYLLDYHNLDGFSNPWFSNAIYKEILSQVNLVEPCLREWLCFKNDELSAEGWNMVSPCFWSPSTQPHIKGADSALPNRRISITVCQWHTFTFNLNLFHSFWANFMIISSPFLKLCLFF